MNNVQFGQTNSHTNAKVIFWSGNLQQRKIKWKHCSFSSTLTYQKWKEMNPTTHPRNSHIISAKFSFSRPPLPPDCECNILHYHAIPCNTMKYHAILMHYHKIHCNTIRNNSIIRFHAIQWNNKHFWPKNDNFRQLGLYNGLPSSRMGTYHKTKGIQDMGILGAFGQLGPWNGLPNGQTATYRKTEGNQSYLRIWGTYDPSSRVRLAPKNGGYMGVA